MKSITKVAVGFTIPALAACGSHNNANNMADANATDVTTRATDVNAVDVNAGTPVDVNTTAIPPGNDAATNSY